MLDAFLVLAIVVVKRPLVEMVKKYAVVSVDFFLFFFDFLDGRLESLLFKNRGKRLVASQGLIRAGTKQQSR